MKEKILILLFFKVVLLQFCHAQDEACENLRQLSGIISYSTDEEYSTPGWYDRTTSNWWYRTTPWRFTTDYWRTTGWTEGYKRYINKCWYINTPEESYTRLTVFERRLNDPYCESSYIEIIEDNNDKIKICQDNYYDRRNKTKNALGGVTVRFYLYKNYYGASFKFDYHIESIACARKDNFRCSEHKCISPDKVCDGKEDCENGRDEEKCGIPEVRGLNVSRINAINWLKSRQTNFGWGKNTHRAITALYLAGSAKFRGNKIEEEMMVKQLELKAVTSVMRNSTSPLSVNELSMYVNALSLTCHNYRNYYGNDLLKALGSRAISSASTSPGAYLTLCNTKWPLSRYNVRQLLDLLTKDSEYPFVFEIQAMTIMALSCIRQKTDLFYDYANATNIYNQTIENFIANQKPDGSFGNVHTTAMVSQALISSGNKLQWNFDGALKFLMQNVNSSSADFLSIYLTLPLFRQKTLVDLGDVDCSEFERKHREDDEITDVMDKLGGTVYVQYSLYIGDLKDVVHTMYLRVPENSSVFDVMKIAQVADHKYRFSHERVDGQIYVYKIAEITNDIEVGKFWLFFTKDSVTTAQVKRNTASPDEIIVKNKEHLIMWYKTADI